MVIDGFTGRLDRRAFEEAAMPLMTYLFARGIVLCGNPADADDLVQDTMALGLRKFRLFKPGTNLKAWLSRLQFNLYVSSYRRRRNRPDGVALDDVLDYAGEEPAAAGEDLRNMAPDMLAAHDGFNEGLSQEIKHGLGELDRRYRDVLLLNTIGEHSYQDIAHRLRVPVGTVMSRLSRAKAHMRKYLAATALATN